MEEIVNGIAMRYIRVFPTFPSICSFTDAPVHLLLSTLGIYLSNCLLSANPLSIHTPNVIFHINI